MAKPSKRAALAAGVLLVLAVLAAGAFTFGPFGSTIEQPIAFPHDKHAGTAQIPCEYCHYSADRSKDAGIPSMQTCAGCHIPGGQPMVRADSAGVKQLVAYWREQKAIPWARIYDLPDHVQFPHMRHVKAGLECQECHGPVETMAEIRLNQPLRMGWCINCHEQKKVRQDCFVCHY